MKSAVPPLYIEVLPQDAGAALEEVVRGIIRQAGHGNPSSVTFSLGDTHLFDGRTYIEFRCLAGSVWIMLIMAVRKKILHRTLIHAVPDEDGGGYERIENEKGA